MGGASILNATGKVDLDEDGRKDREGRRIKYIRIDWLMYIHDKAILLLDGGMAFSSYVCLPISKTDGLLELLLA